jgi:HAD superfamily hydrolase (TIGR01549 family)
VAEGVGSTDKLKAQFYSTLLPEIGVPAIKLQQAVECVLKLAHAEMLWRKAEESTGSTLKKLKDRGLILGVVSNSDGRVESALEQAGLASYFDFFIDSFLVGVEKPDPAIFRIATERAQIVAGQAAYVGDLYSVDVVGARGAGLLPILYDPYDLNREADCIRIRMLDELMEKIWRVAKTSIFGVWPSNTSLTVLSSFPPSHAGITLNGVISAPARLWKIVLGESNATVGTVKFQLHLSRRPELKS